MSPDTLDWMLVYRWAGIPLFAAILSYFSCKAAMNLALRAGMVAHPGERQSHHHATPTGGGLGLVFSLLAAAGLVQLAVPVPGYWWVGMVPGILLLAAIGWIDDKRPLGSRTRLLVQFIVSIWLLGFAYIQEPMGSIAVCLVLLIAVVWLMNLYNFMDGSNGMAAFQAVFAGLVMMVQFLLSDAYAMALLSLLVAVVCIGFLPLNFPHARVFMGDVASVPLGFIFAALAVYGMQSGAMSILVSVLALSVFIIDATLTLVTRAIQGERWYTAHNQHIYQRLISEEWSHSRVLVAYQSVNILLVLPAIVLATIYTQFALRITGLTLLLLGSCWYFVNRRIRMRAARRLV